MYSSSAREPRRRRAVGQKQKECRFARSPGASRLAGKDPHAEQRSVCSRLLAVPMPAGLPVRTRAVAARRGAHGVVPTVQFAAGIAGGRAAEGPPKESLSPRVTFAAGGARQRSRKDPALAGVVFQFQPCVRRAGTRGLGGSRPQRFLLPCRAHRIEELTSPPAILPTDSMTCTSTSLIKKTTDPSAKQKLAP